MLSTFTRTLNKVKRNLPFSTALGKTKATKGKKGGAEQIFKIDGDSDYDSDSDAQDDQPTLQSTVNKVANKTANKSSRKRSAVKL